MFKCDSPLKYNKNILILKQLVMGDEKYILYNNVDWERFGTSEKNYHQPNQHQSSSKEGNCVHGGTGRESSIIISPFQKKRD